MIFFSLEKKLRRSTLEKSKATVKRQAEYSVEKEYKAKRRDRHRHSEVYVIPSQEEVLEEAKETELENLKSLGLF